MREAFTETLRSILDSAQDEARDLNQEFVSTEHLLLGMLSCDACEAAKVLQQNHVSKSGLRAALLKGLPKGKDAPVVSGSLPLSPRSQRAINGAIVKAQDGREGRVSTRLLLLTLLEEPQTLAHDAVAQCGGDVDQLRRLLAQKPAELED